MMRGRLMSASRPSGSPLVTKRISRPVLLRRAGTVRVVTRAAAPAAAERYPAADGRSNGFVLRPYEVHVHTARWSGVARWTARPAEDCVASLVVDKIARGA